MLVGTVICHVKVTIWIGRILRPLTQQESIQKNCECSSSNPLVGFEALIPELATVKTLSSWRTSWSSRADHCITTLQVTPQVTDRNTSDRSPVTSRSQRLQSLVSGGRDQNQWSACTHWLNLRVWLKPLVVGSLWRGPLCESIRERQLGRDWLEVSVQTRLEMGPMNEELSRSSPCGWQLWWQQVTCCLSSLVLLRTLAVKS